MLCNSLLFFILFILTSCNQVISLKSLTKSKRLISFNQIQLRTKCNTNLFALSNNNFNDEDEVNKDGFTQKQLLKEETEAPFRTIRIYIYFALLAAAGLGSLIGLTKIVAINANSNRIEDMNELYTNFAINLSGIPIVSYLWKTDLDKRNSILNRIQKGGSLAGLKIKMMIDSAEYAVVKLSDLRRDRGIDKRVVIIAAEKELLKSSLLTSISQSNNLMSNDLLIIPLCIDISSSSSSGYELSSMNMESLFTSDTEVTQSSSTTKMLGHIGFPMIISSWNNVIKKEFEVALKQQPDALKKGITIIIKKNGKVGTRRFGVPIWESLVNDVVVRSEAGLDVRNI